VTVDFEAKALDVCRTLGASAPRPEAVALVADALRVAALDEGARAAARAELTRLLAEVRAAEEHPPFTVESWDDPEPFAAADAAPILNAILRNPDARLITLLERLCWLLGLSDGERRFVAALADDAGDFDGLSVFADWLEDQGCTADGARVRRLVPQDGDVIVLTRPDAGAERRTHERWVRRADDLRAKFLASGRDVRVLVLPHGSGADALPADAMRAAGWVRAKDAERAVAAAIRASLSDDSDPEAADPEAGVVTFHFATPRGTPPGSAPEAPP
jgi:hypothetical protein